MKSMLEALMLSRDLYAQRFFFFFNSCAGKKLQLLSMEFSKLNTSKERVKRGHKEVKSNVQNQISSKHKKAKGAQR